MEEFFYIPDKGDATKLVYEWFDKDSKNILLAAEDKYSETED